MSMTTSSSGAGGHQVPTPEMTHLGLRRAQEKERTEAELGRCLTREEGLAFDVGFNAGAAAGLEQANRNVRALVEGLI